MTSLQVAQRTRGRAAGFDICPPFDQKRTPHPMGERLTRNFGPERRPLESVPHLASSPASRLLLGVGQLLKLFSQGLDLLTQGGNELVGSGLIAQFGNRVFGTGFQLAGTGLASARRTLTENLVAAFLAIPLRSTGLPSSAAPRMATCRHRGPRRQSEATLSSSIPGLWVTSRRSPRRAMDRGLLPDRLPSHLRKS